MKFSRLSGRIVLPKGGFVRDLMMRPLIARSTRAVIEELEVRQLLTTVSMSLSAPTVTEGSGSAVFTISRDNTTGNLPVFYRVGGSAPTSQFSQTFNGEVIIPAGQSSVALTATPVDDHVADPNRTLTIALLTPEYSGYSLGTVSQATTLVVDADGGQATHRDLFVGPGQTYSTVAKAVAAATSGSYIDVLSSGTYTNDLADINLNNITIRGIGSGLASIVWNTAQYIPNGKGIIVFEMSSSNLTVENMDLEGARVNGGGVGNGNDNGAGIRAQGTNLTVTNCRLYNNEDGILNGAGNIVITYSEFAHNGIDGYTHNLYISTATSLTFEYNYSHDAGVIGYSVTDLGHLLKSRAGINTIEYNTFDDGSSIASYELSTPNGGQDTIIGNLIIQQPSSGNSGIIDYASEVAPVAGNFLYLVNNTVINNKGDGNFVQAENLYANFDLTSENNIFAGGGTEYSLSGSTTTPRVSSGNYFNSSLTSESFVNASAGDYHLLSTSSLIHAGAVVGTSPTGASLTPVSEYVAPEGYEPRNPNTYQDVGAFGGPKLALMGTEYLRLDANSRYVDVYPNSTGTGSYTQYLLSDLTTFTDTASVSADSLTVDFSVGDPLPTTGITFTGITSGQNALVVDGDNAGDTFAVSAGKIQVTGGTGVNAFSAVPITFTRTAALTVNGGTGNDTFNQTAASGATTTFNPNVGTDALTLANSVGTVSVNAPTPTSGDANATFSTLSVGASDSLVLNTLGGSSPVLSIYNITAGAAGSASNLSVNATGKIDLGDNELLLSSTDAAGDTANATLIQGLVVSGQLYTSSTATNSSLAVGYADGADSIVSGLPASQVEAKTTLLGDTDLNGTVDFNDLSTLLFYYNVADSKWDHGNFAHDPTVDFTSLSDLLFNYGVTFAPPGAIAPSSKVVATKTVARDVLSAPVVAKPAARHAKNSAIRPARASGT